MSNDYLTGNKLAAIRTALMCDTPVSMAASLLPEGHVLDTAAYRDAIRTVKKLITLRARIAELEAMVREFLAEDIDGRESCRLDRKGKPRKDCRCIQCKAIALLQPEAGKP